MISIQTQYLTALQTRKELEEKLKKVDSNLEELELKLNELVDQTEEKEIELGDNLIYVKTTSKSINSGQLFDLITETLPVKFNAILEEAKKIATGTPSFNRNKFIKHIKDSLKDSQDININNFIKSLEEKVTTERDVYKVVNLEKK